MKSKWTPSNVKFWVITGLALAGAAAGLASFWPRALAYARSESAQLTREAATAGRGEAQVDYRLATRLDPRNQAAFAGLARIQLAAGHSDEALSLLERAGEGSEVERLKVRTLIELGRYAPAAAAAGKLAVPGAQADDVVLATLADALAGRTTGIAALTPLLASPEALQRVQRVQAGNLPLAAELYATGLLESSSALLIKLPTSFERNLLLGRIYYARHTPSGLALAADFLSDAASLNPASLEVHQLLAAVYHDQNKFSEASRQDALVVKLEAGRP